MSNKLEVKVPSGTYCCYAIESIIEEVLRATDPECLEWSVGVEQINDTTLGISLMAVD